ncbi:CPBP family intramembrane glutamic endopeptidase [Lacticaseibacillus parakribbianus]|uniref:CPBP family intramembrane glutamic endopeptidase n=1 Tax=Lacticaseibacillus parakribbianus TaxID=2970927 RepID=UPI0021CB44B2|nr:type II CAAX endopeptidase family protein [Lacticaseibacillus parakribbianus]
MKLLNWLGRTAAFAGIVVLMFTYQLPMDLTIRLNHWTAAAGGHDALLALTIAGPGVLVGAILWWLYRRQLRRKNPLGIGRTPLTIKGGLFVAAMYGCVLFLNVLVAQFGIPQNQETVLTMQKAWPLTLFLMAALIAPALEELTFRGLFMSLFWRRDNPANTIGAIATSGLVFGLAHEPRLSIFLVLYAGMGVILAYVYRRKRDLRYSLALHMIINFLPSLVGFFR